MAYESKTKLTAQSVAEFIASLPEEKRRAQAQALVKLFEEVTGYPARMWGEDIVGFGRYRYRYASGHSGEAARTGFSPRKAAISLYLYMGGGALDSILPRLGKHRAAKGCVYVNKLADIDLAVLSEAVAESRRRMALDYPEDLG